MLGDPNIFLPKSLFSTLFPKYKRSIRKHIPQNYFCIIKPLKSKALSNVMVIGVPKEIKNNENRVALTPAGVTELRKYGHTVYVQVNAGEGSGFIDEEYIAAGATMLPTIEEVYAIAEMIMKVKEPIAAEYDLIKED